MTHRRDRIRLGLALTLSVALATIGPACTDTSEAQDVESGHTETVALTAPPAETNWAPPVPTFDASSPWELVMADEFDAVLENHRWHRCHWWATGDGCRISSSNELQWYLGEQLEVRDGALRLIAERRSERGRPFVSGMVQSGPADSSGPSNFAFQYGAVEARVNFPAGTGLWPAVWMLPTSTESRPEIDIVEVYGQEPDVMRMHVHWSDENGGPQQRGAHAEGVDLTDGWHTVGLLWGPGVLVWFLDGDEQWRVERDEVPAEPMYLVMNLAVGGDRAGTPTDDVKFPAEMRVDWIRVWQEPSSAQ